MPAPTAPPRLPSAEERADAEEVAARVATEAARLVVEQRPHTLTVDSTKSTRTDVVTVMDQRAQDLLLARLTALRPRDGVHGEEQGAATGTSGTTWVIDPIDGTVNYLYGLPAYAVSVAAVVGDPTVPGGWVPYAGSVVNPTTSEVFSAHTGSGAWLTDGSGRRRIRTTSCTDLGLALVGTGFGYAAALRERQARALLEVIPRVRDVRRMGSAALDLCHVACGRLDAYYETGLNPWDLAAGWVVLTEAGGRAGGLAPGGQPGHDLTWACAPGLDPVLGALAERVTRRHVVS